MRSLFGAAKRSVGSLFATTGTNTRTDPIAAHYDALENLYLNSGVYDRLANVSDTGTEIAGTVPLRSLRNPANRVTEFYAAKLEPSSWGEPEYTEKSKAKAEGINAAVEKVRAWSNWRSEGRTAGRQYAWAGDLFRKVATKHAGGEPEGEARSVYFERIDPRFVREFDTDERGYLTYLRVSTPKTRRNGQKTEGYTQTEIWDKARMRYEVYEQTGEWSEENPGERVLEQSLTQEPDGAEDGFTGYDFIPVVHDKFRDVGKDRGLSCFGHAIGKIRECDRIATRLHEMLFPDEDLVVKRSGVGPDGNPLPPIELEDSSSDPLDSLPEGKFWGRGYDRTTTSSGDAVSVGKRKRTRLPAGADLEWLIPNRNLSPALEALEAQVKDTEADLPETAYSKLRDLELSGRAMRYSLDDVYSRHAEAFSNLAQGTVRLENMALTIGQAVNLPGFSEQEIGTYGEAGEGFDRSYPIPDPFPSSRQDSAEADTAEAGAFGSWQAVGGEPFKKYLLANGYTEDEADVLVADGASSPASSLQSVEQLIRDAQNGSPSSDGTENPPA